MYHWVHREPGVKLAQYGLHPETFARQMEHLARSGWSCLGFADLARLLETGAPLPDRSVVLTFDDGYADLATEVEPVLQRHGFHATAFLVTDGLGGVNAWDAVYGDPPRPLLSAPEARRLDGGTFRFESHSRTHPFLTEMDDARARREVFDSKSALEDLLGRAVTVFSYPHGLFDRRIEDLVREAGYTAAATDIRGLNRRGTDPLRIRRVMMRLEDGDLGFRFKVRSGHDIRSAARALAGLPTGAPDAEAGWPRGWIGW
jgi:peptidoglycan/xylan/chitin deacetylase (PgdA/CDA1 family)